MTKWGILATGGIAAAFAADLRHAPGASLVAVGSRSQEAAKSFAGRFDIPRAHGSWEALAADPDVDVVYVATPHSAHLAAALTCLRAGKAVLCEKPVTLDRADAASLISAARDAELFFMEAMWTRVNPTVRAALDLIADGAIGTVTTVSADFGSYGPFPSGHRLRARELGGGALLDLGVYPVTMAHLVLGAPDHIRSWAKLGPEGTDENTGIVFGYDSGAVASLTCGLVGTTGTHATITGTAGRIELPAFFHATSYTLHRTGADPETVRRDQAGAGYQFEAIEVQRCLDAGLLESPLVPHETTLEVMGLLDEIRAQIGVSYR
ncbi:Gfo/Idh/MocA family oxidoreductase [Asanoa sp. WMMD1127]|uniref:Gfo/Idh/MocA family protein n=1 Tax=Asanoa sp. WMMD1127 TaxID=3016107 RepID=UPI002416DF2B|nr:Gfo/Idh/MocA family oxidoreductase [Asanoa sp. WMMD1127]MDG4822538.1 Gfo/Idh/MocA family oxidoreductase [Asanoa sp. WMMD1127]